MEINKYFSLFTYEDVRGLENVLKATIWTQPTAPTIDMNRTKATTMKIINFIGPHRKTLILVKMNIEIIIVTTFGFSS